MKLKHLFYIFAGIMLSAFGASAATTIADWTFETSSPSSVNVGGVWITNIAPEIGSGTGSALHANAVSYGNATGNGSAKCFLASSNWTTGDFFQFVVNTTGLTNITVSVDSTSSGTGPGHFTLKYSLDGVNFTNFANYTNGSTSFATGTSNAVFTHVFNLGAVTAINNTAVVYFRLVQADAVSAAGGTVGTAGTSRIDNMIVFGSSAVINPPVISGVTPVSTNVNAGATVTYTVALSSGDSPLSFYWYKNSVLPGNLLASQTNASLVLSNVLAADAGSYLVVVSNASLTTATSSPVTLTVADPGIDTQPLPAQTLLSGTTAGFTVHATGTPTITYQWCTGDPILSDAAFTPVPANSHFSGVTSPTLTISNLTAGDATSGTVNNFFCIVTTGAGTNTTTPVSLSIVTTAGTLAFWDFNGFIDTLANPLSSAGAGVASITNITDTVFTQGTGSDNNDSDPENVSPISVPILNNALGTATYPATSVSNQTAGVRYDVSTVGAKNIIVNYDVRETTTASKYTRLQYTTNGTDFTNYPATATYATGPGFPPVSASKFVGPITVDLTGFPGVANNPNFGFRIVSEFISTATYGVNPTNSYVAITNTSTYGTSGTITYDQVSVTGDKITGAFTPPTISAIPNQSVPASGSINVTLSFSGTPTLTASASTSDPTVASASVVGTTLTVSASAASGATPVLVKVTDGNGNSTVTSFIATVVPANLPPVVTGLGNTNTFIGTTLVIPFTISDDHTTSGNFLTTVTSSNSVLVTNGGIVLTGGTTTNPTLTITPAPTNLTGVVPITVTVADQDPNFPKTTTVNFAVVVRPSTNVYLNDNFTYNIAPDNSASLITNSGGFWVTHSGIAGKLQSSNGVAIVDGFDNTEDVNATLIGAPFPTNDNSVLFARYDVSFTHLPDLESGTSGTYISHFKDTGTVDFFCKVFAATNDAADGFFRLGIGDGPNLVTTNAVYIPTDLALNTTYTVVTRMVLSNALSTIWINPTSTNSVSATDNVNLAGVTNLAPVSAYAFRENFGGGTAAISNLRVGKSFLDVVDALTISQPDLLGNVVVTWGNPSFTLQGATNILTGYTNITSATSPYTNAASNPTKYFRLHELQGHLP